MSRPIIVTGGAGYVGSHAAKGNEGFHRLRQHVESDHRKSGFDEISAHRRTHDSQANHSNGHVIFLWHEINPCSMRVQACWRWDQKAGNSVQSLAPQPSALA